MHRDWNTRRCPHRRVAFEPVCAAFRPVYARSGRAVERVRMACNARTNPDFRTNSNAWWSAVLPGRKRYRLESRTQDHGPQKTPFLFHIHRVDATYRNGQPHYIAIARGRGGGTPPGGTWYPGPQRTHPDPSTRSSAGVHPVQAAHAAQPCPYPVPGTTCTNTQTDTPCPYPSSANGAAPAPVRSQR